MHRSSIEVAGTGFVVLDRIYADGAEPFEALGGSCGNVLLSLAMLNRQVAPVLSLGNDPVGHHLVGEFETAGACTSYISRRDGVASPVLVQVLDTDLGQHSFSFVCPETEESLPRYRPIESDQVSSAEAALRACHVFYTDRLSRPILDAMECASSSGALVFFEPSDIDDAGLFVRALASTSILKYSAERLGTAFLAERRHEGLVTIVTHGAPGLNVVQGERSIYCPSIEAPVVRDTCGSGDMVSIGVIDMLVSCRGWDECGGFEQVVAGARAGQRLAAANCAFTGARGLFRKFGGSAVRTILDEKGPVQLELFANL